MINVRTRLADRLLKWRICVEMPTAFQNRLGGFSRRDPAFEWRSRLLARSSLTGLHPDVVGFRASYFLQGRGGRDITTDFDDLTIVLCRDLYVAISQL